jgi:integrase/recombinase XerC
MERNGHEEAAPMNETAALVAVPVSSALAPSVSVARLVEAFFSGRNARTLEAYRRDLEDFRAFTKTSTVDEAARALLAHGAGAGNELALRYRASLMERGLAAATVNRRLAAVRSLVKLARTLGLVSWTLEVRSLKAEAYRDTRGPDLAGFRRLLENVERRRDPKDLRDHVLLRLLHDLALRRGEVAHLDLEDVDLEAGTVAVLGKGRTGKVRLTLPEPTKTALRAWLVARGTEPGPLFGNFDRAGKGDRLTGRSLHRLVVGLGRRVGLVVRPHGLRHAAITEALDLMGGNVRAVARFSRHRDLRVLNVYDDNRADLAGDVARLVASGV